MSSDPFGTAALRSAVLDAWARNPTRLREDANTEEDHATGYYRDRVVVELAQNAADAAVRSGAPGTLLLRLVEHPGGATLVAANTGDALDRHGVVSLASMRASSKSGSGSTTVGRFGVGFAAVRAVADDIVLRTAAGGVCFSVAQTRDALAAVATLADGAGDLAETVAARGGSLPALRLPFAAGALSAVLAEGDDPLGQVPSTAAGADSSRDAYTTVVELTLRDETAVDEVRRQLVQVDDTLLLALPGLATVEIQHVRRAGAAGAPTGERVADRVLTDVRARWWVAEESGVVPAHLVADRPVEERDRSTWTIVWAVPRETSGTGGTASAEDSASESLAGRPGLGGPHAAADVVRAPTPTEEPLTVPAVLVATFPLDPSRRHVADGPLATYVAEQAGAVLADLAGQVDDPLSLVPTGLPAGRLDALVRESVTAALREAPLFGGRRARDVVALGPGASGALLEALAPTGLGAVDVAPGRRAAARALDMPVLSVVDVVDALPSGLTPAQWRTLYDALASSVDTDRAVREALDGIFVPLADGTTARGPRGLVLPGAEEVDGLLTLPGLRLVHPDAVHPLLRRLGAVDADDPSVLTLASVEAAVRDASELLLDRDVDAPDDARNRSRSDLSGGDDLGPLPGLLALLAGVSAAHGVEPADVPAWWGDLPLPGSGGVWSAARDLAWPGSWAASHLDLDVVDTQALDRQAALVCGVRSTLTVRTVDLDTGDAEDGLEPGGSGAPDVPGWADYDAYLCAVLGAGTHLDEVSVLLDLDVVHDDAWGEVLRLARQDPEVRRAVVTRVGGSGGSGPSALSYAAWYLRDVLAAPFVVPDEDGASDPDLLALLPGAPADLDGLRGAGDRRRADGRGSPDGPGGLDGRDGIDAALLAALGGVVSVGDLAQLLSHPDPMTWDGFFAALDRPEVADGVSVAVPVARAVWAGLGAAAAAGLEVDDLPDVVVAVRGGVCRTVDAQEVLVAVEPMWSQVRWVVPARDVETAEAVADLLDVPVADATAASVQASDDPAERVVPAPLLALLPGLPGGWLEHTDVVVDGQDVDWWVTADGTVHVRTGTTLATTAQGLAQSAGCWTDRHLVEILLADPSRARDVDLARSWDP
ncbi:ATP-binding protein [Sanguibacter sp. 4.1]|uniref:ATP-binding protein n=1 Tax=Sanguibacter biliveldensis TaxID=3030830 RepID=A0AAF1C260_9MICO|nr:ATP-binding protein [Sanguibacter sp. 4.1]WPF81770.1 ATP-binding protein [Sanguibacter sp. 4.1]